MLGELQDPQPHGLTGVFLGKPINQIGFSLSMNSRSIDDSIIFPSGQKRKHGKADTKGRRGFVTRGEGTRILVLMSWVEVVYFVISEDPCPSKLDLEVSSV